MSKREIAELNYIEYNEALNYSVITHRMRNMATSEKKNSGDNIPFNQPANFGKDPNFVSKVN